MQKKLLVILMLAAGLFLPQAACAGDTLLIDDFSRSSFVNLVGGNSGGDEELPGRCCPGFVWQPELALGGSGRSLRLDFDVSSRGSFTFCWMKLGIEDPEQEGVIHPLDLTGYNYLSFMVKGAKGKERIKVELHQDTIRDGRFDFSKDVSSFVYVSTYLAGGIHTDWQKAVIPLKDFHGIRDWSNILELVFTFENRVGNREGSVYIDDILFGSAPEEVLESRIPAAIGTPFKSGVLVNKRPIVDGFRFGAKNKLSIKASDGAALPVLEGIRFEYTNDEGRHWRTIGTDYDTKDENYQVLWKTISLVAPGDYQIRAAAIDVGGNEVYSSKAKDCTIKSLTTREFLELISKKSFEFFRDNQDPDTGLFRDTAGEGDASVGVCGFGLTALAIGAERGWINRKEAQNRALKCIYTFLGDPDNSSGPVAKDKHGFYYHFIDTKTAERAGKCEVSTVDTALLLCGALTAGEYFGGEIKEAAQSLYGKTNWPKFLRQIHGLDEELFTMGWAPERGFLNSYWDYYTDEALIVSLLAIGSPTHPVGMEAFYNWQRRRGSYKKTAPYVYTWHGSLFAHQYAHAWFDLRGKRDNKNIDWWVNSRNATLANRQFAIDNSITYTGYGPYSWGITSMDHPEGYVMHYGIVPNGRGQAIHDGTISPSGPAGSMVFTPILSIRTLKNFYYKYPFLWGKYGFLDSFNLDIDWISGTYYGLGQGITLLAIENFRSGFVWNHFSKNRFITDALSKAGFQKRLEEKKEEIALDVEKGLSGIKRAKARITQLKIMEEADTLRLGRLYLEKVDSFYDEIEEDLVGSIDIELDRKLALEGQALLLVVYGNRFQSRKAELAYQKLVRLMEELPGDESFKVSQLNKITTFLTGEGFDDYALQLRVSSIPSLSQASITEVIRELKIQADELSRKGQMHNAEPVYNQYLDLVSQYGPREETERRLTELADQHFEDGQYNSAIRFYNQGLRRFGEGPSSAYWQFKIARSYEEAENHQKAIENYEYFLENFLSSEYLDEVIRRLAMLYYTQVLSVDEAISRLKGLLSKFSNEPSADFTQLYIGLLCLKLEDYKEAFKELKSLLYNYPASTLKYSVERMVKSLEKKPDERIEPGPKPEGATQTMKIYQVGKPIIASLDPIEVTTRPGSIVVFGAKAINDEDKFSVYEQDLSDVSRIPSMTKVGYEDDICPLEWDAGAGGFLTEEHGATKQWRAPGRGGRYEVRIKVSDLGLVRVPDKGDRNDKIDNIVTAVIIVKPIWPMLIWGLILAALIGIIVFMLVKRKRK